jgi:hypothetical protein
MDGTGCTPLELVEKIMHISTFGIVQVFISCRSWVDYFGQIIKYDKIRD